MTVPCVELPQDLVDALTLVRRLSGWLSLQPAPAAALGLASSTAQAIGLALAEIDPLTEREYLLVAATRASRLRSLSEPLNGGPDAPLWLERSEDLVDALEIAAAQRFEDLLQEADLN